MVLLVESTPFRVAPSGSGEQTQIFQQNVILPVKLCDIYAICRIVRMTPKDRELLALLKLNAREPVSSLARKLGISRSTVQDRIRRLEEQGVIAGYSVVLAPDMSQESVRAIVTIGIESQSTASVVSVLKRLPSINEIHTVSGRYDLVVMLDTASPAEMDHVLERIGMVEGVLRTESAVILSTRLDRR